MAKKTVPTPEIEENVVSDGGVYPFPESEDDALPKDEPLPKEALPKEDVSSDVYTHILKRPFTFEGKTYEEITFEWGKLTGRDSLAIENEVLRLGKPFVTPEFSSEYLIRMAAKACTLPIGIDLLEALPLPEFNRIKGKARTFLMLSA